MVFIEACQNEVKTNISSNDISKITRLGRKKEDSTPRPILVCHPKMSKKGLCEIYATLDSVIAIYQ